MLIQFTYSLTIHTFLSVLVFYTESGPTDLNGNMEISFVAKREINLRCNSCPIRHNYLGLIIVDVLLLELCAERSHFFRGSKIEVKTICSTVINNYKSQLISMSVTKFHRNKYILYKSLHYR